MLISNVYSKEVLRLESFKLVEQQQICTWIEINCHKKYSVPPKPRTSLRQLEKRPADPIMAKSATKFT